MKSVTLFLSGALLAPWVGASPAKPSKTCTGNNINGLRNNPQASPYCSSFLGTATSTVSEGTTTTTTTISVTPDPITTNIGGTETDTVTETDTATETDTITVTSTTTTTESSCLSSFTNFGIGAANQKRAPKTKTKTTRTPSPTPKQLSGKPSATQSSLCNCIGVTQATATNTVPASTKTQTDTATTGSTSTVTISSDTATVTSTATITNTVTSTETDSATATATTANGPLSYFVYNSPYSFGGGNSQQVDYVTFKSANYVLNGSVSNPPTVAPGNSVPTCTFPDGQSYGSCDIMAVVMQGWFLVPQTGQYTFTTGGNDVANVDNGVAFWAGDSAQQNWANSNADFLALRNNQPYTGGTSVRNFNQGDTIPITLIYLNAGGAGSFEFQIITPDGVTHSDTSQFWVTACGSGNDYPFSGFYP